VTRSRRGNIDEFIRGELEKWARTVKAAGIKAGD